MELTNLISKLTEYYKLNGISASGDFTCIHKKKCMDASIKFEAPREPDLGPHYGKNIPKLLFLSLDRGWSAGDKTIQRRLNWKPGEWIAKGKVQSAHWYRTCEIAYYILCKFNHSLKELTVEDMVGYFAHVNSAKCCQLKDKGTQADSTLFYNCKEYLKEEIIIFEPDIVVTQGDKAKVAINEHYCKDNELIKEKKFSNIEDRLGKYWIITIGGKRVLWFHTYHPSRFGDFNEQRRKLIVTGAMGDAALEFYNESGIKNAEPIA